MGPLLLSLSLAAAPPPLPPPMLPRRVTLVAHARIVSGTVISLSDRQQRPEAAVIRKGLIEFR
jgi:hypothetical protein